MLVSFRVLAMTLTMAAMVNLMEIRDDREDDAHNAKPWLAQSPESPRPLNQGIYLKSQY